MEHSLKGSYTAILIGHLIADNERFEDTVRKHLHGNGFKEIISVLEKYYNFMDLAASVSYQFESASSSALYEFDNCSIVFLCSQKLR